MGRVVHFEITAENPDRAAEFYRKVFGWDIADWGAPDKYLLATTGPEGTPGINGAITTRHEQTQPVITTIDVPNWERAAEAVKAAGGKVLAEKSLINGVGYFAYAADTEGNVFGILESIPEAAAVPPARATEARV